MPETYRVLFHPVNKLVHVLPETSVLEAIRLAEIPFESVCGGKGECNKCRVIFLRGSCTAGSPASIKGLTPDQVERNYCRACQTIITGNCEFTLPVESRIDAPRILQSRLDPRTPLSPAIAKYLFEPGPENRDSPAHRSVRLEGYTGTRPTMSRQQHDDLLSATTRVTVTISTANGYPEVIRIENGDGRDHLYGVALDLGTTTVAGVLVNLANGAILAEASVMNRQITCGEELLTRIAFAKSMSGAKRLQAEAVGSINDLIGKLTTIARIPLPSLSDLCIAGNTVMSHLLLGLDTQPLEQPNPAISRSPFVVPAHALNITADPNASVYVLPAVSRFVGGDAIGDVIASGMSGSQDLSLMIDLGTNGEIVLGNAEWLSSVSCASGPAFEGGGISSGMRAMRGAIDHVRIDPGKLQVTFTTIDNEPPRGICGSGIIDAAASMAAAGIIDFTGKLVETKPGVRSGRDGLEFVLVPCEKTGTGRDICITSQDMIYLMDTKAAVCAAIGVLLKKYRVGVCDIRHVFLAGAFGAFSDMHNLVVFGIVPDFKAAQSHAIGNGSLAGAIACLVSQEMRRKAHETSRQMVYIDLLVDADFIEEYTAALHIPGRPEYFPK